MVRDLAKDSGEHTGANMQVHFLRWICLFVVVVFGAIVCYEHCVLGFNPFISDVAAYWEDSLHWSTPFNTVHVPGYPLMLAAVRFLTLSALTPMLTMWIVALASKLASLIAIAAIMEHIGGPRVAAFSLLLFALWPFEGITSVASPIADPIAICLTCFSVLFLLKQRFWLAALMLAAAIVTHKATWYFVPLLMVAALRIHGRKFPLWSLGIVLGPLLLLWIGGTIYHGNAAWILTQSVKNESVSHSSLPLLDGLVGTLLTGQLYKILKGVILWALGFLALGILYQTRKASPSPEKFYSLALLVGFVILLCSLNQNTIWASVRFGALLVIPFGWSLDQRRVDTLSGHRYLTRLGGLALVLVATQFAFAWYTAQVFFKH